MTKTIYDVFKDFPSFYAQLKPRFMADFRPKDKIGNLFYSARVYEHYKHDQHYGDTDTALNKIMSQIAFDSAEINKKELIWSKVFDKIDTLREITTRTEEKKQTESTNKTTPPKTTTIYQEPLMALQDLASGAFGYHNRADWLKSTQKQQGGDTITNITKEGMKVVDKEGKVKTVPNWIEVDTSDNAGIAKILTAFQYVEIDLNKYLARYKKFFYRSYGLDGQVHIDPTTKRHIFKNWEEVIEEQKPEAEQKRIIPTEEAELSFGEWKKKFKEEHPGEKPTFTLFTLERLERRKAQLEKEFKKTSGVFKDKIGLRLTFTQQLIDGFEKEITMPEVGNINEKLPLEASDEELEKASYWAKVNRVVGFKEFKKIIGSFVRGYNRLSEKKIDKPCQMYLLLGPPGVGKSFISEMLAEAMNRPIEVISMNGEKRK